MPPNYRSPSNFSPTPNLNVDPVQAKFQRALALHQQGQLGPAQALYEEILKTRATHADALHLLGVIGIQTGNFAHAVELIGRAIRLQSNNPQFHSNLGVALKESRQFEAAAASFNQAIRLKPDYADAYANRGNALKALGRLDEAIASYDKAIAYRQDFADAYFNRGNALHESGQLDDALASYDRALALQPKFAPAHANRGVVLKALKRLDEAIASIRQAIALRPDFAEAHAQLGVALQEQGSLDAAVECFNRAITLNPNYAEAYSHLGVALMRFGRFKSAIECFDQAIALDPNLAQAYSNRGVARKELRQIEPAIEDFKRAIALAPSSAYAHYNLGNALQETLDSDRSEACYLKALELKPDYAEARWALAFLKVPTVFRQDHDPQVARTAFDHALDELDQWFVGPRLDSGFEAVGTNQPFFLAYQEFNNRALMSKYGAICHRLMAHWQQRQRIEPSALAQQGKIKLGIVAEQIRNHSVWRAITKGLVLNLDRSKFDLHIFHLGTTADQETDVARAAATQFVHGLPTLTAWSQAIHAQGIEVLLYPEIGMHPLTTQLANLRLAPVQMVTWGHPEPSGLPSIDYYLSAELFETAESDQAYTERLIRLPHLGCSYPRAEIVAAAPDLAALGLDGDAPLLICPGMPFKYAPQYDWILVQIARRLGRCRFVFFSEQTWRSSVLAERLQHAFEQAGLDFAQFVTFIPWLKQDEFYGLMQRASVFLDTLGFSGFNTALQAVECALPIATKDGQFMRGRLASAILKRLGLADAVARSDDEYIAQAVHLVQDTGYRQSVIARMQAGRSLLYDDQAPIRAFEEIVSGLCRAKSDAN